MDHTVSQLSWNQGSGAAQMVGIGLGWASAHMQETYTEVLQGDPHAAHLLTMRKQRHTCRLQLSRTSQ